MDGTFEQLEFPRYPGSTLPAAGVAGCGTKGRVRGFTSRKKEAQARKKYPEDVFIAYHSLQGTFLLQYCRWFSLQARPSDSHAAPDDDDASSVLRIRVAGLQDYSNEVNFLTGFKKTCRVLVVFLDT